MWTVGRKGRNNNNDKAPAFDLCDSTFTSKLNYTLKTEMRIFADVILYEHMDTIYYSLFTLLNIIKLSDRVNFHIVVFMFKFRNNVLPSYFDTFFFSTKKYPWSQCKKRERTNYGKFNICSFKDQKYGIPLK